VEIRSLMRRALRSTIRFAVYDREGLPCRRCRTAIARILQAGRSTYFCPGCQIVGGSRTAVSRVPRATRP
jgi:formamidopyrimidine-DNA glycosylase